MSEWTDDERLSIGAADELRLSSMRADGTLRNPVTMWVVRVGDDLFVRAVKGPSGPWYKHALDRHRGRIDAGGVIRDVEFISVGSLLSTQIDAVYKSKYAKYGDQIVGSTLTSQAQAATIKLVPVA